MEKFKRFISVFVICTALIIIATTVNAKGIHDKEISGNDSNNNEDQRVISQTLDLENIPDNAYYPGIIKIRFERDFEKIIENTDFDVTENDIVKTGLASLDKINKTYNIHKYKPMLEDLYEISEASLKYKERHRKWGFHLWYELKLDNNADIIAALIDFESLEEVKIAEPVLKKQIIEPVDVTPIEEKNNKDSRWTPNDQHYEEHQWHFNNTGQTIQGQQGIEGWDCNAEAAWEIETGNSDVIVAIIDSGMEYLHEDLEGNMWENIGPEGTNTTPGSHGTHVGGTVAAVTNNNIGVAGLAGGSGSDDGVSLMTIAALGSYNTEAGFQYAADNGAAITQNSWGFTIPGQFPVSIQNAIDYFNEHGGGEALDGGITIFAAGNENSSQVIYPAAYEGAMAVASHDNRGKRSSFSSYGEWIDIIAPGTNVASTNLNNGYTYMSGTSMACPHVSGAAALVVSHAYGELTNDELWNILIDSANDDIYAENPNFTGLLGSGRLDAYQALRMLNPVVNFEIKDEKENPIDSAIVTFDGQENEPGDYQFTNVEEGTYDYTVEKEGYFTSEGEVTVEDEDIAIEVTMFEKYTVTFDIYDEHGNEITEAVVNFKGQENEPGDYVFENIGDGTFDFKVEKEGYFTTKDDVTIEGDATVEVTLYGAYKVTFNIEDNWGNVVENAVITFDKVQQEPGKYVFKEIKSGKYDYEVEKNGYHTVNNTITINNNHIAKVIMNADGTNIGKHEKVKLSVFPNPTRDIFNIESNEKIKEITMIDIRGQIIRNIPLNSLTTEINVSNIRPGIYFMEIQTNESVITKRVKIAQ